MSKRLTNQDFIFKSTKQHGYIYDYSLVDYINYYTCVRIICKEHGVFEQRPDAHYKVGCPKCSLVRRSNLRRNDKNEILCKFNKKHSDRYDYSKIIYTKMRDKVLIKCIKHNIEFYQTPEKHLESKSGGCPKCNSVGKGRMSNELFLEKANNIHCNKYDYSMVEYVRSNSKIKIICKQHGLFEITPNSHLSGRGCSKCSGNYKYKIDDLLSKYNEMYDDYLYNFTNYLNIKSKVIVKCPKHSVFETTAELLLNGYGCSSCGKKSLGEERISEYLLYNGIEYIKQKSFDGCVYKNKMQFDFYIPDYNTCIEYDGRQHFEAIEYFGGIKSFNIQREKDNIKNDYCNKNNIRLIRIPYYDYVNIEKILESLV